MEKEKFAGIFPALMTAFGGDSGIDMYSIARLVEKLRADGVNGLYVGGSSAEMILCSTEERRKILEGVMSASDGLTIIAHIGAASTNDSLELARHAVMCGVDAISSVTPFYYKYRFDEVKHYYERLADVGLPLIIYKIPALTGASYGFDQLCELLEIPGVEGMKFTSSDFYLLNRLAAKYPEKVFYNGSDEMLLSGLAAGADGGIGTTAKDPVTTEPEETTEAEILPDLPSGLRFDGTTIRLFESTEQLISGQNEGEVVSEAIYYRTMAVEDQLGVKFESITRHYAEIAGVVRNSVNSGSDPVQ